MKKITFVLSFILFCSFELFSQGFKHPGMLHTNEDFVRIKAQLAANNPAVVAGYNNLKANEWSQSTVGTYPSEIIKRGIAGDENYINAARGAHAAYLNALRWKISGDVSHANKAVSILNAWAAVTTAIGGNSNLSLASGIYGYEFANAAELMRDYSGWKAADFKKFQNWMLKVWYPYAYDFLIRRHGTWEQGTPGHYWSNWGLCNALTVVSIGVLLDDEFIYNQGLSFYKYDKIGTFKANRTAPIDNDGLTEFIGNLVPTVAADARSVSGFFGQMQESGRDQGHATMALGLAVDICETAWNQGDDLYGYMDDRLLAGIEYVAAYNSGIDALPWTEYWYHDVRTSYANSWKQLEPNSSARGQFRPYWDRILGHYEGRKGVELVYAHKMADLVVADAGAVGSTSGGYDHLGFSTLTCTRPLLTNALSPTTLKASISYNGKNYLQSDMMNVVKSSVLTFIPSLPDSVTDTGNWKWSNGHTEKNLTVNADSSAFYRVEYINSRGVKSTQLFSVAVYGDCLPDIYSYTVSSSDKVTSDTLITTRQHSKVKIEFSSSSWRSSFLWSSGDTNSSKEILVANKDTSIEVAATNLGGAKSVFRFQIIADVLGHSYKVNAGDWIYGEKIIVSAGASVVLNPTLKLGYEGGKWQWSNGDITQSIQLNNIQTDQKFSVNYILDEKSYTIDYNIILVPEENAFSYWPLDDNGGTIARDVWAGNNAAVNAALWNASGIQNAALSLDGNSESFVQLPNDLFGSIKDFTISCWINPGALDTWARVWDFGAGTNYNMFLTVKSGDGYMRFTIKVGTTEQIITTTKLPDLGMWSHLVVTKSANTANLYLNGVLVGTNTALTLNPSDLGFTNQNYLGKSQWPDPMYKGEIDELRFYNKGMSKDEILKLMSKIQPLKLGYSVDGGSIQYDSIISVNAGQKLILTPMFKSGINMSGGTWLWSNGSTLRVLTLSDVQKSEKISVSYIHNGNTYTQDYLIYTSKNVTDSVLVNPGFNISNTYLQGLGSGVNLGAGLGAVQSVNGWLKVQDGEWAAGSSYDYGYLGTFNGAIVPNTGSNGAFGNGNGALALSAGWGNGASYYQTVTLPAGKYSLESMNYNANALAVQGASLLAWIPESGASVVSTLKSFTSSTWVNDVVQFNLEKETKGKIQLGLLSSAGAGTGSHAKIFIDYVKLRQMELPTSTQLIQCQDYSLKSLGNGRYEIWFSNVPSNLQVYNLNGMLMINTKIDSSNYSFSLPVNQLYILQIKSSAGTSVQKLISY